MSKLVYRTINAGIIADDFRQWVVVDEYRYQWAGNAFGTTTVFYDPASRRFYIRRKTDFIDGGRSFWFQSNPYDIRRSDDE